VGASADQPLDALFAAITDGDIDAVAEVFAEDVKVWHNITDRAVDRDQSLAILRHFVRTVDDRRYEILERRHWDGGAMQRHVVHGTVDGAPLRAPVAIIFELRGDKITKIHEYVDSAAVQALMPKRRATAA